MGVAYHAHARFLDPQGHKVTMPAPVDPQTPYVPWWFDWSRCHATARQSGWYRFRTTASARDCFASLAMTTFAESTVS
jgi:hypothetical protein